MKYCLSCKIKCLKQLNALQTEPTFLFIKRLPHLFGFTLVSNTVGSGEWFCRAQWAVPRFCPSETTGSWNPPPPPPSLRKRSLSAWKNTLGYYRVFMVPSCVVRPKRRPRVKASCKIYVHAAVTVGGKINIAGLMHGDDWVLSDWQ